jgi:beta-N-acetylhexosaminidase
MMTAHVHYPAFDPTNPATLSPTILTGLLRQQMGFSGVILSDDLEMRAILDHSKVGDAAVRSLQAGVDMLLVCKSRALATDTIEAVRRAIQSGDLDPANLETSLARIASVKQRFVYPYQPTDTTTIPCCVGIPAHRDVLAQIQNHIRPST